MSTKLNRPGAPANQRQHLVGDYGEPSGQMRSSKDKPSSSKNDKRQVSDPHPQEEEGYNRKTKVPMTGL